MKIIFILLVAGWAGLCPAQTPVNKSIPVSAGQSLQLYFDYPNLIRVSSWDKNEIQITGSVSINNGENDDAFVLTSVVSGNEVKVKGEIPNIKSLPHQITIRRGEEKIVFKNKAEYEKYKQANGATFDFMNRGSDIEISLDIKVPASLPVSVESVYGIVELKNLKQSMPLSATSTYGGVDAALHAAQVGELFASTDFGQIYSNLDISFSGEGLKQKDFHTEILARPGKGARYRFESKYGNVYLRKN